MPNFGGRYHKFTQELSNLVLSIKLIIPAEGLILDIHTGHLFAFDCFRNKGKDG